MTKKRIFITLAGGIIVVGLIFGAVHFTKPKSQEISLNQSSLENKSVPLPQETDIIRSFFEIINEGRAIDAISMMAPSLVGDDDDKQAWGVQFNAFKSLKVASIERTNREHEYKVVLTALIKPEASRAPIPNYGWDNGTNIRWIILVKSGNLWKISAIATGP